MANEINPDGVAGANLVPIDPKTVVAKMGDTPQSYTYRPNDSQYDPNFIAGSLDSGENYSQLQEFRAQQQSIPDRIGNAIPRLLLTTGTKLGTGLGYIGGAVGAIGEGLAGAPLEDAMATMLDNGWVKFFENTEEKVKEELFPIYKTRGYLNGNVWQQMGTASFWADDVTDGLAFMASAYVPGMAAAKLGTGAKMASLFGNSLKAAKLGKYVEGGINLEKLAKGIDLATTTALATTSEAGFEASDTKKQVMRQLTDIDPTTGQPTGKFKLHDGTEITEEQARQAAAKAALGTYGSNLFALALSNGFEASQLLGTFAGSRKLLKTAAATGLKEIAPVTFGSKLKAFGFSALKTSAVEGAWEENIQQSIQDYEKGHATGATTKGRAESLMDGWLNNFTTDEGQKSIMLGAIIGLIPGGIGGVHEKVADNEKAKNLLNAINNNKKFTFGKTVDFLKKTAEDKVYINPKTGEPELDIQKAQANYVAFMGAKMNHDLAVSAISNDDKVFHDYLNNNRVAAWGFDYLSSDEGTDMFDTDIDFHAKMEAENINQINKQLGSKDQTPEAIAVQYKAKARQYKRIYDTIVGRDVFLAKLGNSKADQQLKSDLTKTLFQEAVNQVNLNEAKNALIAQQSAVISDLGITVDINTLDKNNPAKKEYDRIGETIATVNELIKASEDKYANLNDPKARKDVKEAYVKQEQEIQDKRTRADDYAKELAFKESITKNLVKEGLDENNNHAAIEGLLKEAKSKNIKNAQALIDARLDEIIREKNNDTNNDEFKTTATPEELAEAEKIIAVTDTPVESKNIGKTTDTNPSTFTYTNPKTKVSTTYSVGNDIVYLGTKMRIIAIGDKIVLVDKSKGNQHSVPIDKLIEHLDSQIDKKVEPKKDTATQPTKQTNAQVLDKVRGLSGIKKDSTMDKLLHWYDVDIKAIRYDISGELASIKKASQKNRLEMLDSMLQLLQLPQTANDKAVRARINAVLESFGYDVNEVVVSQSMDASLPSTGESVKDQDIPVANYTKEVVPTISLKDESSFNGVNLSLTDFRIDDISRHYNKDGDLQLTKKEAQRYLLLKSLRSGDTLSAKVDTDWMNTTEFKKENGTKPLSASTIPIQLTHSKSDGKTHINTIAYLQSEIALTDLLLHGVQDLNIKLNDVLTNIQSAKTLSEKGEMLWKYFGKGGIFDKNSKVAPLYNDKSEIVPTDLEGKSERVNKLNADIQHISRVIGFRGEQKTQEDHFNNLSNWKNRLKTDLNESLDLRNKLFEEYSKGNTEATIDVKIDKVSQGSIEKKGISKSVHDVFGDLKSGIVDRVNSYQLVSIPAYNQYEDKHNLYDVSDPKTKDSAGTILFTDNENEFIPGRLYLVTNETLNGDRIPIILDVNTWTKDDSRFNDMMDKIHSIINTFNEIPTTRLADVKDTALDLNEYINVILEKDSNSKEFRIVGAPYEEGSEVKSIIEFVDKNSNEYHVFVRNADGTPITGTKNYEIRNAKGKVVDSTIEDMMVGKFKNIVFSKFAKDKNYRREVLANNDVVSTRVSKVLDESGDKVGLAQVQGRYPYTVSIEGKTLNVVKNITSQSNTNILLFGLHSGFHATSYESFDIRGDRNIMEKISNEQSFATTTMRNGKTYIVVGLRLIQNVGATTIGRDGYSFAMIEDSGSLTTDIISLLTNKAVENTSNIYKKLDNITIDSFKPIDYDLALNNLFVTPTVAKSATVQVSEEPIITNIEDLKKDIEVRRQLALKQEYDDNFKMAFAYADGTDYFNTQSGKNALNIFEKNYESRFASEIKSVNDKYDKELLNLTNTPITNNTKENLPTNTDKPTNGKRGKAKLVDTSKFGLLQSMPTNDYAETFINDTLGVNSNTKTGTKLDTDKVLRFVNEHGTSLDNEFIQVLKNNVKDLTIIVDNEETDDNGNVTVSYYDPTTKTLGINLDYFIRGNHENFKTAFAHAFSHENIHIITLNALGDIIVKNGEIEISNPTEFHNNLTELLDITRASLGTEYRGTKDVMEFIAESISNPLFQSKLQNIEYKGQNLTVWGKFKAYVKELFNRLLGLSTVDSVFDRALNLLRNEVSNGITINNIINKDGVKIKLSTQLTEDAYSNAPGFTSEEQKAATNFLLGKSQFIIFGNKDLDIKGDKDNVSKKDIFDDDSKDLRSQLIELTKLHRDHDAELSKDAPNSWLAGVAKFHQKVLDNLENDRSERSLYWHTKNQFSQIHNTRIFDYDDVVEIQAAIDEADENKSSLTRGWDEESAYSRSTEDTFEPLTRKVIATLPVAHFDGNEAVISRNEYTGTTSYVNYKSYTYKLLEVLGGMSGYDEMYYRLNELATYVPTANFLIQELQKDENVAAAFYSDMNKQFMVKDIFLDSVGVKGNHEITAEVENKKHSYDIANNWVSSFKYNIANKSINTKSLDEVAIKIKELPAINDDNYWTVLDTLSSILDKFNINVEDVYIDLHLRGLINKEYKDSTIPINELKTKLLQEEYITRLKHIGADARNMIASKDKAPKINSNSDFNKIAESLAKYTFDFIEPSAPNIHGDLEYGYRLPNWIGDFIGMAKSTFPATQEKFLNKLKDIAKTPEGRNSNWLWTTEGRQGFLIPTTKEDIVIDSKGKTTIISKDNLNDYKNATINQRFIDNFDIRMLGGIKNTTTGEGNTYTELSDLDFRFASLLYYLQGSTREFVKVPSLIIADSGQAYNYTVSRIPLKGSDIVNDKVTEFELKHDSALFKSLQNIAIQEVNRIHQARELLYSEDGIFKGVDKLKADGIYPHLLEDFHYKVDKKTKEIIFEKDGKPVGNAFKFYSIPTFNDAKSLYTNGVLLSKEELQNSANAKVFNQTIDAYVKSLIKESNTWFDASEFKELVDGKYSHIGNGKYHHLIAEMILNQMIANVEQQNFFSGVTAEFADILETVKRIKALTSPGRTSSPNGVSRVMISDRIRVDSISLPNYEILIKNAIKERGLKEGTKEYKELYDEILSDYRGSKIADGQGWITPHAYILREKEAGRFGDIENLVETYNHPQFGLRYKFKDNLTLQDYKVHNVIPQIKKFFTSDRKYSETINRFTREQLKYSSAIMLPSLIKGTDLERIAKHLEDNNIDEFITKDVKKEGLNPLVNISNDGRLSPTFDLNTLSIFEYENSTRRVQLDVPDAIRDKTTKHGIQVRKHMISNINPQGTYILNSEEVTGEYIINEYNNLISQNIVASAQALLSDITVDGDINTLDKKKVSKILVDQFTNRNRSTNTKAFVRYNEELQDFEMPLGYSGYRKSIMSVLTSLFTKAVNDQKLPGGHAVLMSNAFFGTLEGQRTTIEYDQRLRTYQEMVNGQNTLVVETMLPAYSQKFFNDGNEADINSLPDELKRIIGFRIPTSGKHSVMVLKVVKFLPVGAGSTIVLADDVVAQMGSDFDVDSMYLMMPSFTKSRGISDSTKSMLANNIDKIAVELTADGVDSYVPALYNPESTPENKAEILNITIQSVLSKNVEDRTENDNKFLDAVRNSFNEFTESGIANSLPIDLVTNNYNYNRWSLENNTTETRNNRLLEIMMSIMGNPAHIAEIIRPAKFDDNTSLTNDLKSIIPSENDAYNPISPIAQLRIRRKAVNGRNKILPIAANWNTGVATLQVIKARLGGRYGDQRGITIKYDAVRQTSTINEKTGKPLTNKELLASINKTFKDLKTKFATKVEPNDIVVDEKNKTITINHKNIAWNSDGSFYDIRGRLYADVVAEDVDNAADTLKGDLPANLTPYTYNTWAAIKATSGDTRYAGYFINQSAVRLLNYYKERSDGLFEKASGNQEFHTVVKRLHTDIFKELIAGGDIVITPKVKVRGIDIQYSNKLEDKLADRIDKYGLMYWYTKPNKKGISEKEQLTKLLTNLLDKYNIEYNPNANQYLSKEELRDQIVTANTVDIDHQTKLAHLVTQLGILNTWKEYNDNAKDLSNVIRVLNIDKLGVQSNFEGTKKFNEDLRKELDGTNVFTDYTDTTVAAAAFIHNHYSMLNAFKENSNDLAMQYIAPLFITEDTQFTRMTDAFRAKYGSQLGQKADYIISRYENYLFQYLIGDNEFFKMTKGEQRRILGVDLKEGEKSLAMKIVDMKNDLNIGVDDVHILNTLNPDLSPYTFNKNRFQLINTRIGRNDPLIENEVIDSVYQMYYEPTSPEQKELVEEMLKYAYLTNGLSFGRNSFINLIPARILKDVGLNEHIRNKEDDIRSTDEDQDYFPDDIEDKFIRSNTDNYSLVPSVFADILYRDGNDVYTKNNTPTWEVNSAGNIVVNKDKLKRVDNDIIKKARYIRKYYTPKGEEDSYYIVYAKNMDETYDKESPNVTYRPISRFGGKNIIEPYYNEVSIFDDNSATTKRTSTEVKTETRPNSTFTRNELLEDYSQSTGLTTGTNKINLFSGFYNKSTPNDKSKGFFFTENLQAYLANRNRVGEVALPTPNGGVKLNVTSNNNQAGIRTNVTGISNKNAFAILSKKYQQSSTGSFVKEEGQFKDTDSDFELFKKYNSEAIQEAINSRLPLYVSSAGIAVGKSALPLRFATWLQQELFNKLGINSAVIENNSSGYKGYGLSQLSIRSNVNDLFTNNLTDAQKEAYESMNEEEKRNFLNCL